MRRLSLCKAGYEAPEEKRHNWGMHEDAVNPSDEPAQDGLTPAAAEAITAVESDGTEPDVAAVGDAASALPPPNRKGAIIVFAAIIALLAGFFGYVAMAPKGKPADGTLPVNPAGFAVPDVRLPRLDGNGELAVRGYPGKVVVVNFWASWCGPCKEEAPILAEAEKRWRDKGVVFIGIDTSDKDVEARAFEQKYGIEYESMVDPSGDVARKWGVTGYPETFFIGKDGRVVSKYISNIDVVSLDQNITAALSA